MGKGGGWGNGSGRGYLTDIVLAVNVPKVHSAERRKLCVHHHWWCLHSAALLAAARLREAAQRAGEAGGGPLRLIPQPHILSHPLPTGSHFPYERQ